jgi:hypothetical protein
VCLRLTLQESEIVRRDFVVVIEKGDPLCGGVSHRCVPTDPSVIEERGALGGQIKYSWVVFEAFTEATHLDRWVDLELVVHRLEGGVDDDELPFTGV